MKKTLFVLCSVASLFFYSCNKKEDLTPPTPTVDKDLNTYTIDETLHNVMNWGMGGNYFRFGDGGLTFGQVYLYFKDARPSKGGTFKTKDKGTLDSNEVSVQIELSNGKEYHIVDGSVITITVDSDNKLIYSCTSIPVNRTKNGVNDGNTTFTMKIKNILEGMFNGL